MQGIKALVIGMGMLILVGTAVLIYGWTHQWSKATAPANASQTASVRAPSTDSDAAVNGAPYDVTVPLPDGAHFEQMTATSDRVLLRFSGPGGERIVAIDPRTGHISGSIGVPVPSK